MILRKANELDFVRIHSAVCRKHISFCTHCDVAEDYLHDRLYAVVDDNRVLATVSLVEESEYGYTAIKRLCILNKKNQGKGIARFAIHEILRYLHNCKVGATPWEDNYAVRHILESEGFKMEYKFNGHWCFYSKEM